MDTTQPPLECAGCGKPIWPNDPITWRTGTNDDGEHGASLIYHQACAPEEAPDTEG